MMKNATLIVLATAAMMILAALAALPLAAGEQVVGTSSTSLGSGGPLDYDGAPAAWVESEHDTPTGTSFMLYENFGGFWADAEKSPTNTEDDLLCWAATASNMMEWTGWGFVGSMDDTDDFLQYFINHVTDEGSFTEYGHQWWFMGDLPDPGDGWSSEDVEGGNFWSSSYDYSNYAGAIHMGSISMQNIALFMQAGYATGLSIYQVTGDGAHAITCWGYNYDPLVDPVADPNGYFKGVWVSDSDSHKGQADPDDFLIYYDVEFSVDNNYWYMPNYGGGWWIEGVNYLKPFPGESRPVADTGGPYVVDEGTTVHFDAGGSADDDSMMYRWDYDGDGTWDTGWVTTSIVSHTWYDDYEGTVYLEVFDGRLRDMDITTVTVNNVAPSISIFGDVIDENGMATVHGTIYDPGIYDTFELVIDWGEGSPQTVNYPSGTPMYTIAHQYLDDNPTGTPFDDYPIQVTVTDDDGGVDVENTIVTVSNVNPVVTIDSMVQPNPEFILPVIHTLEFYGSFSDVGTLDTHDAEWDWGDGVTESTVVVETDGSGTVTGSHIYMAPGTYTATLTVWDDDTGYHSDTFEVVVVDAHGALDIMDEYIQNLPDSAFKKNPDKMKAALSNIIGALHNMVDDSDFYGAIMDLQNNVLDKMDGQIGGKAANDWIIDLEAQEELAMKISDICQFLALFI